MKIYNLEQVTRIFLFKREYVDRFEYVEKELIITGIFFKKKRWSNSYFNDKWELGFAHVEPEKINTYSHGKYMIDPEDKTKIYEKPVIYLYFSDGKDAKEIYFLSDEEMIDYYNTNIKPKLNLNKCLIRNE